MLLEVRDLDVFYGPSHVLHGTALSLDAGEVLGVVGRNGMGKTTLVHTIAGFMPARRGAVTLEGRDVTGVAPERISAAGVTLVPQGHRVFPSLSVGENLQVAARPARGPDGGTAGWSIDDVCDWFPILRERWGQRAGLLSGGQQQMLAIGRALVGNGRLVLMDEPSEGLDPSRVAKVGDVIAELKRRGTAVLLVEQKLHFVLDLADRVEIMTRGEITHRADAASLRADPSEMSRQLGLA